ncbi:MAG: glycosyltransferase family 4 protein [Puniceicoccaceae bacterium]
MKHSFAATNPCHVYDMALALQDKGALGCYYSGYPRWRLNPPAGFPMVSRSWRTLITYGLQRCPEQLRPDDARMFRWQDKGFDAAVANILQGEGCIHGLPGQCLETFKAARRIGMTTVLNHASGPMKQWRALVAPEYERMGRSLDEAMPLPDWYEERLQEEWDLADYHCVASTVVRDQLMQEGVSQEKIWVVPYGADQELFQKRTTLPEGPFKVAFAGRQSLRKGIHYLLKALEHTDSTGWELHCFGMEFAETQPDFEAYKGGAKVVQRGSLSQAEFARALQDMDVLVLPSAEEAFGLVVVQALQVGVPCIVSDRVGAKDLIREGQTGSVVTFGDVEGIAEAVGSIENNRILVADRFPWDKCAEQLLEPDNPVEQD